MGAFDENIEVGGLSCRRFSGEAEAALLFAAGRVGAARACLDEVLEGNVSDPRAWTLLFDLHRALGEREPFDAMLAAFREVFPRAPLPSWESPPIPGGPGVVVLSGVLACAADLQPLRMAHRSRIVAVDLGRLARSAFAVIPASCAELHSLVAGGRRIILANVCELHEIVLREVGLPATLTVLPRRAAAAAHTDLALAA